MRDTLFVHPLSKQPLRFNPEESCCAGAAGNGGVFKCYEGVCDFASLTMASQQARQAYDGFYAKSGPERLSFKAAEAAWHDSTVPWRRTMLESIGSLEGRSMLLLGNGESYKELHFLRLGAKLIFSDLSLVAVQRAKAVFERSEFWPRYKNAIEFHAIDAMHLPLPDDSLDVVFGSKFVGFLESMAGFLGEVHRCLRPGGICRFSDDAESPAWEAVRKHVVVPFKRRVLSRSGNSVTSVRSASRFGVSEQEVRDLGARLGYRQAVFVREYFCLRAAQLAYGKLVRWDPVRLRYAAPVYLAAKWFDNHCLPSSWMRKNALGLTWGLDK